MVQHRLPTKQRRTTTDMQAGADVAVEQYANMRRGAEPLGLELVAQRGLSLGFEILGPLKAVELAHNSAIRRRLGFRR